MTSWLMPAGARLRILSQAAHRNHLISALNEQGSPCLTFDWDPKHPDLSGLPRVEGPHVVYGGYEMLMRVQEERPDLRSGVFCDPRAHGHDVVTDHIGDLSLNASARILSREEVLDELSRGTSLFLRPVQGDKAFNGHVVRPGVPFGSLPEGLMVAGPVLEIVAEYRFIVVDGVPVTGSQYRRDGRMDVRIDACPKCREEARRAARIYSPLRVFTCDVAETPRGPKVVEYNSFSSSGLYACDGRLIVQHVNSVVMESR